MHSSLARLLNNPTLTQLKSPAFCKGSAFAEEAIQSTRVIEKLNLFNIALPRLCINNKLCKRVKLAKAVPGLTQSEYSQILRDWRKIKSNVNSSHKGKHPFKFFPRPMNYEQCEIWEDNTIPIWTNGSAYQSHTTKAKMGWGVFFKQLSLQH
jgi:hypothetical protein